MLKKILLLGLALISLSFGYKRLIFGLEAGAGYVIKSNDNHPYIDGSAIFNIKNNLYARLEFTRVAFHSNNTHIFLGTLSPVDLLLFFPQETFNPYAIAGLKFSTATNLTDLNLRIGAGVEFKLNQAKLFPYVEGVLELYTQNISGNTGTDNIVTAKGGIRIK
ncbi:MAG: hypothetical protein NZ601_00480 [candidate division WOR-3 bacterium]|nr:hypothetical protein [candidate division WOR-3 bacterium]MCX7757968.1 hypothetical protein [candidate division WOR-3 bacterium]MDW7987226.1 hypothetical protein [candidate division WOR-3 bacterium]